MAVMPHPARRLTVQKPCDSHTLPGHPEPPCKVGFLLPGHGHADRWNTAQRHTCKEGRGLPRIHMDPDCGLPPGTEGGISSPQGLGPKLSLWFFNLLWFLE